MQHQPVPRADERPKTDEFVIEDEDTGMSHWNYRVIEFEEGGYTWWSVNEVYYDDDGNPNGYVEEPADVWADDDEWHEDLLDTLMKMRHALDKPVLRQADLDSPVTTSARPD